MRAQILLAPVSERQWRLHEETKSAAIAALRRWCEREEEPWLPLNTTEPERE